MTKLGYGNTIFISLTRKQNLNIGRVIDATAEGTTEVPLLYLFALSTPKRIGNDLLLKHLLRNHQQKEKTTY